MTLRSTVAQLLFCLGNASYALADEFNSIGVQLSRSLVFIILLILIAGVIKQRKFRKIIKSNHSGILKVLQEVPLSGSARLYVIDFDGQLRLLGLSEAGFCVIDRMNEEKAASNEREAGQGINFKDLKLVEAGRSAAAIKVEKSKRGKSRAHG